MTELALTRASGDRKRYDLPGYGSLRRVGWLSRESELRTDDGRVLTARQRGALQRAAEALDPAGSVIGDYRQRRVLDHGGDLAWSGLPYEVSSESALHTRYVVSRHQAPVVRVHVKAWGGRAPATVTVADPHADAGLVLFTVWLAQTFAHSSSGDASAAAT